MNDILTGGNKQYVGIVTPKTMVSEVFNTDCLAYMKTLPDKFFDLAIVDPPYQLKKSSVQGSGKLKNRTLNRNDMSWDVAPPPDYSFVRIGCG